MSAPAGSVRRAATGVLRATVTVDRSQLAAREGLRSAAGVGLPLVAGLAGGRPLDGAAAAGGALFAGFAAYQSGYRVRALAVAAACLGVTATTFVGVLVGHSVALLALTAAAAGFGAGLVVSLGPAAAVVGLQSVLALLVISAFPGDVRTAAWRALLVLLGGAGQLGLVMTLWPLRRYPAERRSLAAVFRALARYADAVPAGQLRVPPDGQALAAARAALGDPQPFARPARLLIFRGLHDEAERVRTSLGALVQVRRRLADSESRAGAVQALDQACAAAAELLHDLAGELERTGAGSGRARAAARVPNDRGPADREQRLDAAGALLDAEVEMAGPARGHAGASLVGEAAERTRALRGQLRAARRILDSSPEGPPTRPDRDRVLPVHDALVTLRANLSTRSTACRHGLRLAVVLGLGTALASRLPFEHRYWVPLTALVVLKPDFASTFSRGTGRILGTLVGAGAASLLAVLVQPGRVVLAGLVVALAWAAYTVLFASYAAFGACITGVVVFLVAFVGLPTAGTALDRVEATVLGGALALVAYAVWPTWTGAQLPAQLAGLVRAQERYGAALLAAYAGAEPRDRDDGSPSLRELRNRARLARSGAEAAVEQMLEEPGRAPVALSPDVALGLVAAARRFASSALGLHAHLPQAAATQVGPALRTLADEQRAAMEAVAEALQGGTAPAHRRPAYRQAQERLVAALAAAPALDAAVLDVETDAMADSVGTMTDLLGADRSVAGPPQRRRRRFAR